MAGSSTWMLPLLLLSPFITFLHSATFHQEFDMDLENFGRSVENCSKCNSTLIECQCFNDSMSTVDCGFPGYFIKGLESLHNISKRDTIGSLIVGLKQFAESSGSVLKKTSFCYHSANPIIISPKCLYEKLKQVRDYINSGSGSKELLSNASVAVNVKC